MLVGGRSRSIGFGIKSTSDARQTQFKWFPYNKGGGFRKWFGNHEYVVNWKQDGYEIKEFFDANGKLSHRPQNTEYYFRDGITWTFISSSYFGVRYSDVGAIFDVAGSVRISYTRYMKIMCWLSNAFLC